MYVHIRHDNLNYHITVVSNVVPHTHQILVDDESMHARIFDTHVGRQNQA